MKKKIIIFGHGSNLACSIITKNVIKVAPKFNFEVIALVDTNKKQQIPLIQKYLIAFIQKIFNPSDKITVDVYPHFFKYAKGIKKLKCIDVNSKNFIDEIENLNADYAIVVGAAQIMKNEIISKFKKLLNYHNSYLPECGGLYATSWEMYESYQNSGFTYHYIENEQIDKGNILVQKKHKIDFNKTPHTNEIDKTLKAVEYLTEAFTLLKNGNIGIKQMETGSYYSMLDVKKIRQIESLNDICEINRKIHCFNYVIYRGNKITKIDNTGKIKRIIYLPVYIFLIIKNCKRAINFISSRNIVPDKV